MRVRRYCVLVLVAAAAAEAELLASCGAVAGRSAAVRRAVRDTRWYVSERARKHGKDRRALSDSLQFGAAIYERRDVGDPLTTSVEPVLRGSVIVSRDVFVASL